MSSNGSRLTLRLYGPLRQAAGGRDVELDSAAATVKEALAQLVASKGSRVLAGNVFARVRACSNVRTRAEK